MLNSAKADLASAGLVTRGSLARELAALGLRPDRVVMLHASVRALGWVVGGPDTVLQALLDVLGPEGTLMMYAGWEDDPYHMDEWGPRRWQAYLKECPPFDPRRSRANRSVGVLAEYLRTWPGARRSDHPEASVVAVGRRAADLTRDHPRDYPYGPGSPLERLVKAGGKVLLLGSPPERVTLLHLAENLARAAPKRLVRYRMPVLRDGERVWERFEDFDTSQGALAWSGDDYFGVIVRAFLGEGRGLRGPAGDAQACLLDAQELLDFAVAWMEAHLPG